MNNAQPTPGPAMDDDGAFLADDSPMPIMDDDDDAPQPIPMSEDSRNVSTGLSFSRDESAAGRGLSIGGLNVSDGEEDASSQKRKVEEDDESEAEKPKPKRRRKAKRKRRIVLNDHLELSGAAMKAQLHDTSDIVRQDVVHPATWVPGKEPEKRQHPNTEMLYANLSYERLFTRPSLGDDGHLAPELLELWGRHTAVVVGKPFPYELRKPVDEPETEQARDADEGSAQGSDGPGPLTNDDDGGPPSPDDEDGPMPMMDDDDGPPPPDDDDFSPAVDEDEEMNQDMEGMVDSPDSRGSAFSFSLVNDLLGDDEEDEDNPRQTLGSDELTSSKTKWHKHTMQVFSLLKSRMSSGNATQDDDAEATEKPSQLSYKVLSHGCTRRTASTVFLELLQLKTWDYVELDQDETFGEITILPGTKFDDEVPTKA